jgi:hypothetical protein
VEIGPLRLMAVFIAATLLGFASHAPAGLGVFDATILIGLGSQDREQLLAALLMFRFLYHFVPLSVALVLFGAIEALRSLRAKASRGKATESLDRRIELEPDHAGHDQGEAHDSDGIGGLTVEQHADENAADGTDPGPYRVRSAERQRP